VQQEFFTVAEAVLIERLGSVAVVRMNLPAKRNALGPVLVPALAAALTTLQDEPGLRALVLSGGAHFCAGGDLSALDDPPLAMRQSMQLGHRIIRALTGGALPVVAAVEGTAYGAGFSMALACDFVVADANTRFCAAFGRVGLVPDYGLLWTLPQRVGLGLAREILMFCEPIDGTRARELGLVDRLCDAGAVQATALALAQRLALAPPATIATTKAALARLPLTLDTMLAWEADTQSLLARTADFGEGVKAFAEKRSPRFEGA
jgi:2-(1,2-epoxy-1,2-dihydrophenyl)acetyl-CoA isomerase